MAGTAFDFTGIDDQAAGGQTTPAQEPAFDFGDIKDAPKKDAKPAASPAGTVKFDFDGVLDKVPAVGPPSIKPTLAPGRPDLGAPDRIAPDLKHVSNMFLPDVHAKDLGSDPVTKQPYAPLGQMYDVRKNLPLAPGTMVHPQLGIVVNDAWETEMKPGFKKVVDAVKSLWRGDAGHRIQDVDNAIVGALETVKTPAMIAGAVADLPALLLGVGVGTGSAQVVEKVGQTVGAREDFTHLAADVVGLYAGGKGAGMVRSFEAVADRAAATEAASARIARMDAEKDRLYAAERAKTTAARAVADAPVLARLGRFGDQVAAAKAARTADTKTAADTLAVQSQGLEKTPEGSVRTPLPALPAHVESAAETSSFSVDLPLGVLSAPDPLMRVTPADRIKTSGVSGVNVVRNGDTSFINYQTPYGPVSMMVPTEDVDVRATAVGRMLQDRTEFPATFSDLPVIERSELRRIHRELDDVQFGRSLAEGEVSWGDSGREDVDRVAEDARRKSEGNLLKVTAGSPVLHDITEQAGVPQFGYSRPQIVSALQKYFDGGKLTKPAKAALVVARRRLTGGELEGFHENPLRPPALPAGAGDVASDFAGVPEGLVDPQAYLEAQREQFYQDRATTKVQQFLSSSAPEAAQQSVQAVLKATPEVALATRSTLRDLKANTSAWKAMPALTRQAITRQLEYLDRALPQAMVDKWVKDGKPGLTVFPKQNIAAIAESGNPVLTDVLPEPGRVGMTENEFMKQRGQVKTASGRIARSRVITIDQTPNGWAAEFKGADPRVADQMRKAGGTRVPLPFGSDADFATVAADVARRHPGHDVRPADPQIKLLHGGLGPEPEQENFEGFGAAVLPSRDHLPFDPAIERPVQVQRDLSTFWHTIANPVEQVLQNHPLTKPIADRVLRGADLEPQFVYEYTRKFQETHKGLTPDQRMEYSDILNRFADPADADGHYSKRLGRMYSAEAIDGATKARQITNEIFRLFPENATAEGTLPQFISSYLTHIEKVTKTSSPDIFAGITQAWDHWYDGIMADVKEVFARPELATKDEAGRPLTPRALGAGRPRSRFVEHRTGNMQDIELHPEVIWPIYVKSAARVIVDKPTVDAVRPMIEALPDSKLRDLTTKWIRNYSRYDAYPEVQRGWQALTRTLSTVVSRSVLGLSPRLAMLHLARLQGVYAEMPNAYFWKDGLRRTLADPVNSFHRTAQAGLLPNNTMPWEYRPAGQKIDTILNFMDGVDFFDRSVALHGFEAMYREQGLSPADAYTKAVAHTKQAIQFTDRARVTFAPAMDSEIAKLATQFKAVPVRIIKQMVVSAQNAKADPARAARHAAVLGALMYTEAKTGQHLIHVGRQILSLEPPAWTEVGRIVKSLYDGEPEQALTELVLLLTPAGLAAKTTINQLPPKVHRAIGETLGIAKELPALPARAVGPGPGAKTGGGPGR